MIHPVIKTLFLTNLSVSFTASLTILMLLIASPFIRSRYAAKWKCRLWIFPAARLLIPVNGAVFLQPVLYMLAQAGRYGKSVLNSGGAVSGPALPQASISVTIPQQLTVPAAPYSEKIQAGITFLDAAALLWVTGVFVFAALHVRSYLHLKKEIFTKGWLEEANSVSALVQELSDFLHIKRGLSVIRYPRADSPMLFGFLHPVLVLPDAAYGTEELFFILRHELVHFRHRDNEIKLLLTAAGCLHWFNPFVFFMQKETAVDMELACDERVVQDMDFAFRKAYTETLLSALHKTCTKRSLISAQFYGGKQIMKKRFQNILINKTGKNETAFLLFAAAAAFSLSFLTGCSFHESSAQNPAAQSAGSTQHSKAAASENTDAKDASASKNVDVKDMPSSKEADVKKAPSSKETDVKDTPSSKETAKEGQTSSQNNNTEEFLAYIKDFDSRTVTFDAVEWVTVPGKRASELGIEREHMDSGFYVYNEEPSLAMLPAAENCVCSILNWTDSYEPIEVTAEEFSSVLKEREGTNIPYHLTVKNQEIVHIQEQYIP